MKNHLFIYFTISLLLIGFCISFLTPLPGLSQKSFAASPFITKQGTSLILNNKPFQFTGYNQYSLNSSPTYTCGSLFSNTQVSSILDEIKNGSRGTVIRTWFFQSFGGPVAGWTNFDRIIAAAKDRGMFIVPTLENQWGDCEPQSPNSYKSLSWYQTGYKQTNDGYPLSFYDYATSVTAHYANEPTIAFWQIMNEAEDKDSKNGSCNESAATPAMEFFANTMALAIKIVDPNHLINLGSIGSGQCGMEGSDYEQVQSGPNLDLLEYHDYNSDTNSLPGDQYNGFLVRVQQSITLNKPLFIGEAGITANTQSDGSETGAVTAQTLNQRATDFRQKMTAQFAKNIAGYLIWNKGETTSISYDIGTNDPTENSMNEISLLYNLYFPQSFSTPTISITAPTINTKPNTIVPTQAVQKIFPTQLSQILPTNANQSASNQQSISTLSPTPTINATNKQSVTPIQNSLLPTNQNHLTNTPTPLLQVSQTVSIHFITTGNNPIKNGILLIQNGKEIYTIVTDSNGNALIPLNAIIVSIKYKNAFVYIHQNTQSVAYNTLVVKLPKLSTTSLTKITILSTFYEKIAMSLLILDIFTIFYVGIIKPTKFFPKNTFRRKQ